MSEVNDSWDRTRIIGKQMSDRLNGYMDNEHTRKQLEAMVNRSSPVRSLAPDIREGK